MILTSRVLYTLVLALSALRFCLAAPPVYTIGNVPPLEVAQGSTLQFELLSPKNGAADFSYAVDPGYPAPQGTVSLNSGLFTYSPDPADKFQFSLRFTSVVPGQLPDSQSVVITPTTFLSPESDVIQHTTLPDGASTDYLVVTQSQNAAPELFNGTQRTTWNVEITGKTVVFDSSAPSLYGGLYTRFHNRPDMKSLSIYAETLIIRSPLKLPATNLNVYARQLRFEDMAGQASIDTTPLGYVTSAAQFQNGLPGQKGGDLVVHIQSFYSQSGVNTRFVARGGKGQDAGPGQAGAPMSPLQNDPNYSQVANGFPNSDVITGGSTPPVTYEVTCGPRIGCQLYTDPITGKIVRLSGQTVAPKPTPVYENYQVCSGVYISYTASTPVAVPNCNPNVSATWGSQAWPANGQDATPAGKPGNGGPGGAMFSSVPALATLIDASGETAGAQGVLQLGGPPQEPAYSAWVTLYWITSGGRNSTTLDSYWFVNATHTAVKGNDSPPPPADIPVGASGTFTTLGGQAAQWLHPNFLRMVLAHAKDAYRGGDLDFAKGVFKDYLSVLSQYGTPPPEFALAFDQAKQQMEGLLTQIDNGVDYFGNGPGWVPLLSLQANMQAFSNEVDADVPLIYLSRYLQSKADQNQKDVNALQDSITKLSNEISQTSSDVNTALQGVPTLQFQASQITTEIQQVETALQNREAQLLQQAKNNVDDARKVPFWQQAVRILGTIAEAVPAKLPGFQAIATGLNILGSIDNNTSWQTILNGAGELASGVVNLNFQQTTSALSDALNTINPSNYPNTLQYAQSLSDAAQQVAPVFEDAIKKLEDNQISDSDVRGEFDRIRAQDGALNDLIRQVSDLQTQKAAFDQALQQTKQTISTGTTKIDQDLASIASLYQNLNSTAGQIDHAALVYVKDMELRARERLLRYQYYMAKAYEYRMLQPYPSDLNIDSVVNQILSLLGNTYPADLSGVKALYIQSVRQIVSDALTQLQTQPPERSLPFYFNLTTAQLQLLNHTGQLTLDLTPLIAGLPNEDDRHIADLGVANITVQTNGTLGPAARVRIVVNHKGQSIETLNGHRYQFYFGTGPNDQPFTWGASYNLPSGPLSQETFSISGLSLLQSALNIPGPIDPLMLFARPGADAVVTINSFLSPSNLIAQITSLQMYVTVDFFRTNSNRVNLSVGTADEHLPYVALDHGDITGRSDGLGSFQRSYNLGDRVTLTAEPIYQGLWFKYWADDLGNILTTSTKLTLTLTGSTSVHPVYVSTAALSYIPVSPCRVLDTRTSAGPLGGPYIGPTSSAGRTRSFNISSSTCLIPSTAQAYSVNVTVVPHGSLGYLTVWPTGQTQPLVSTLNSIDGRIKANAAIVPAGSGGAISVYATDDTDLILDINGYFVPATTAGALAFYPMAPCRLVDTRSNLLSSGALSPNTSRTLLIGSSSCNVPAAAQAYSLNFTVVPPGALDYLSVWPTGQSQPFVSTLNDETGTTVANAAIVQAGTSGSIDVYVTNTTDLVVDINGYFAPAGAGDCRCTACRRAGCWTRATRPGLRRSPDLSV